MRQRVLLAALVCAALGAAAEARAVESALAKDLERCIRANAGDVERAIPELDKATDFLIDKVCAVESSRSIREAAAGLMAERTARQEKCEADRAAKAKDAKESFKDKIACYDILGSILDVTTSSAGRALAARLLLDLRVKRLEREGRQL